MGRTLTARLSGKRVRVLVPQPLSGLGPAAEAALAVLPLWARGPGSDVLQLLWLLPDDRSEKALDPIARPATAPLASGGASHPLVEILVPLLVREVRQQIEEQLDDLGFGPAAPRA